jgi:hypothetical protein
MSSLCSRGWLPAICLIHSSSGIAAGRTILQFRRVGSCTRRYRHAQRSIGRAPTDFKGRAGPFDDVPPAVPGRHPGLHANPAPSALVWNQMGIAYEMLCDYK